jgi:uncharacterized membrane protein YfhO
LLGISSFFANSTYGYFFLWLGMPVTIIQSTVVGNLMITLSLVPIFFCPSAILRPTHSDRAASPAASSKLF